MNERPKREEGAGKEAHVRERIHACLDGELLQSEEERVRAHCRSCAECGRAWAEAEALVRFLESDGPSEPLRSFWPEVGRRLERPGAKSAPIRIAAALAVAAGIFLGLFFPPGGESARTTVQEGSWSEVGTYLSDSGGGGLADVYLLASAAGGEDAP
ncbi:MAG: zf-HC2 domain-containing protein [Candidatus Eisenbacteria bacterium]